MSRKIEATIPPEATDGVIKQIKKLDGLIGLSVQRDASALSPGDVVSATMTDSAMHDLMRWMEAEDLLQKEGVSVVTSEPAGVIQYAQAEKIALDSTEALWEETENVIGKESNGNINTWVMMAFSGVIAAAGIATNALHIVIAAMVLAPGFAPLVRISLGLLTSSQAWRRGLVHALQHYALMTVSAALTGLLMAASGRDPLAGEATYLAEGVLLNYWTSITFPSVMVSFIAGIVGAILLTTNRSVLTLGVMIALALVPTASLVGIAAVMGRFDIMGQAFLRWSIDVVLVIGTALLVIGLKRAYIQRRKMSI
jgi:hypothetical protein